MSLSDKNNAFAKLRIKNGLMCSTFLYITRWGVCAGEALAGKSASLLMKALLRKALEHRQCNSLCRRLRNKPGELFHVGIIVNFRRR